MKKQRTKKQKYLFGEELSASMRRAGESDFGDSDEVRALVVVVDVELVFAKDEATTAASVATKEDGGASVVIVVADVVAITVPLLLLDEEANDDEEEED